MPVKTAPDGSPIKRNISAEQWEAVGRRAICDVLRDRRDRIDQEIEEVISAVEFGAPLDETHFRNLRAAIEILEVTVEHDLVELVPTAESWERTIGRIPYGLMCDALEVDLDGVNRLRAQSADPEADSEE